jgi:hypothetical protein
MFEGLLPGHPGVHEPGSANAGAIDTGDAAGQSRGFLTLRAKGGRTFMHLTRKKESKNSLTSGAEEFDTDQGHVKIMGNSYCAANVAGEQRDAVARFVDN